MAPLSACSAVGSERDPKTNHQDQPATITHSQRRQRGSLSSHAKRRKSGAESLDPFFYFFFPRIDYTIHTRFAHMYSLIKFGNSLCKCVRSSPSSSSPKEFPPPERQTLSPNKKRRPRTYIFPCIHTLAVPSHFHTHEAVCLCVYKRGGKPGWVQQSTAGLCCWHGWEPCHRRVLGLPPLLFLLFRGLLHNSIQKREEGPISRRSACTLIFLATFFWARRKGKTVRA